MKTIKNKMKMKSNLKFLPLLALAGLLIFTGCEKEDETMNEMGKKNIVEVASNAGQFSILIQAAQRAGLDQFLSTESDLTVFAPTDAAFTSLLNELKLSSLNDIPVADLTNILKYHVIGSKAMSTNLSSGYYPTLATSNNNNLSMYVKVGGGVSINQSIKVTTADVEAKNGVIHVVDKVILPPSVVNIALQNENFSILVQAVVKAGLVDALSGNGPFTVFAPTNEAFTTLFSQLGISGINDLSAEQLIPILTYHVVPGNVLSKNLSNGEVGTLNTSKKLNVNLTQGVRINDSRVVAADIQASNGVVHVIDKVLIP